MFNPMSSFPEGETVDSVCNACDAHRAPLRLRAMMVPKKESPQVLVPAIVMLATRQPPDVVTAAGIEKNQKFNPMDFVPIATWEIVEEFCNDEGCFQEVMKRLWKLGQDRLKLLWKQEA